MCDGESICMHAVFVKESGLRIRVKFILKKSIICLFGVFLSHWKIFHSFGDVNIAGEGLQILTYAWNLWPFRTPNLPLAGRTL